MAAAVVRNWTFEETNVRLEVGVNIKIGQEIDFLLSSSFLIEGGQHSYVISRPIFIFTPISAAKKRNLNASPQPRLVGESGLSKLRSILTFSLQKY